MRIGADEVQASDEELRAEPLPYRAWGEAGVDDAARLQMETAPRLPVAAGGALMADAHVGPLFDHLGVQLFVELRGRHWCCRFDTLASERRSRRLQP